MGRDNRETTPAHVFQSPAQNPQAGLAKGFVGLASVRGPFNFSISVLLPQLFCSSFPLPSHLLCKYVCTNVHKYTHTFPPCCPLTEGAASNPMLVCCAAKASSNSGLTLADGEDPDPCLFWGPLLQALAFGALS